MYPSKIINDNFPESHIEDMEGRAMDLCRDESGPVTRTKATN
jgi:hypothetical protein